MPSSIKKVLLIEDGIILNTLLKNNGCMRTDSYVNLPIPRMRMTYLLPNQIAVIPPETGEYVMFSQGFSGLIENKSGNFFLNRVWLFKKTEA
jgi:predicted Zn-dependent protease